MIFLPKPPACIGCPLYGSGYGFSEPTGSGSLGVLIVGEALGEKEEQAGRGFVEYAPAGSVLERAIRGSGFSRDQFGLWNILGCRPPFNKLEDTPFEIQAINHCKTHFRRVMEAYKPKVILALGGIALRTLTGHTGYRQGITALRGFSFPALEYPGVTVVGSLHPSFLRRGAMNLMGLLVNDLHYAVDIATNGVRSLPPVKYIEHPSLVQAKEFRDEVLDCPDLSLAYDVETAWSRGEDEEEVLALEGQVIMAQFSLRRGTGIAFPWQGEYRTLGQQILSAQNRKLCFNGYHFDNPKLVADGAMINGEIEDLMWKAHHMQPELPRNLQSVASLYVPEFGPWKHLAQVNLEDYGIKDVDVLHWIDPPLTAAMEAKDVLRGYERHIRGLWPVLERVAARGLPVDKGEQDKFREDLNKLLVITDTKLQEVHPQELRNVSPPGGYTKTPKDTTGLVLRTFSVKVPHKRPCRCVDAEGEITGWGKKGTETVKCPICKGKGLVKSGEVKIETFERWAKPLPFRPSQQQLVRYIRWKGHPVPKSINDPSKDSTAKLQIDKLAKKTKDPLYLSVLDYRGIEKMKSAYVDAWVPGADGRVHPKFKFTPSTGQLAAVDPNCLTLPTERIKIGPPGSRLEIGKRFRQTIKAPDGLVLVELDFSAFHAMTLAFEAEDEVYMRIANMDPHSFLTARMLRLKDPESMLAMGDEDLRAFLSWVKKNHKEVRDGKAKAAILGYGFCLGARKMFEMNQELRGTDGELLNPGFTSQKECKVLIDMLRSLFPKTRLYQIETPKLVHRRGYQHNLHGYIRWFWDVLKNDPETGEPGQGDQFEAAVAFNPACDAHGHIKDCVLRLDEMGANDRYGLVNIVHDSIVFACPKYLVEELIQVAGTEMSRPSTVLVNSLVPEGLVVRAETKIGYNMGEMKSAKEFFSV